MNQKNITDQLRNRFTADLAEFLAAKYDVDVCQTAAGTIMIPAVDGAGMKPTVPTATAWRMSTS